MENLVPTYNLLLDIESKAEVIVSTEMPDSPRVMEAQNILTIAYGVRSLIGDGIPVRPEMLENVHGRIDKMISDPKWWGNHEFLKLDNNGNT